MSLLATTKAALEQASPLSVKETGHAAKGYHLDASFPPGGIVRAVAALDALGFFIETMTGVDWLGEKAGLRKEAEAAAAKAAKAKAEAALKKAAESGEGGDDQAAKPRSDEPVPKVHEEPVDEVDDMEVVYDFNHYAELCRVVLRVRVPRDNPVVPTISDIYQGAHWHERETHDFLGIRFEGHPYLVPLLLPEDADFHPLRKDYKP